MKTKHPFPIYPVFLAPIPILILLQANIQQVNSLLGLRLVIASMVFAAFLLTGIGFAVHRKWRRAAFITSIVLILFNLYGFLVWWSALPVVAFSVWLAWNARPSHKFTNYANFVTVVGMVAFLAVIGWQAGSRDLTFARNPHPTGIGNEPDIYFIVLDSHTSHELLLERFGYDNTPFLDNLTSLGFQVGDCQSIYPYTDYSIASTLNPQVTTFADDNQLQQMIRNSQVRSVLEARGYQTVGFATGFVWTEFVDADIYYHLPLLQDLNIFETYYLERTPFEFLLRLPGMENRYGEIFRDRTLNLLEHLPDAAALDGPQFVFAHIVQPHPPIVFDPDGNPVNWQDYVNGFDEILPVVSTRYDIKSYQAGYLLQVQYIENAIISPLTTILNTNPDSIIILAGDHGPWFPESAEEAFSILCAVHGPDLPLEPRAAFEEIIK